jgi:hypothetical protein
MAKKQNTNVIIGVPCSDAEAMKALTAQAIGGAIIGANGLVSDMILRRSCDIVSNRTFLVNAAIKAGASHILFVDCDMLFPYDVIPKLLAHKKPIVGVQYHKREFPLKGVQEPLGEASETELYKAKHAGTGLLLIDLSIFEKIKGAWFNFGRDSQGALVIGEDVWFCNTARDAGFDTWIDPTIKVGHLGEYTY